MKELKTLSSKLKEEKSCKSKNKLSSLIRFQPCCSIHNKKIGISASNVPFFYFPKSSNVIHPSSKKTPALKKTSSLSSLSSTSSTIAHDKKSTNIINSSDIVGRVSIASSNANFQGHQVNNVTSKNHLLSAKSFSKANFISPTSLSAISNHLTSKLQGNAANKKITRANNASSLSTKIQSLTTKKITRSNNTSSLSEANTKDELRLKQNNFFSKERHSSFKKLDAVIQDIKILKFEIDNQLNKIISNHTTSQYIPFKLK